MIKKYNQYIKESLLNKLEGPTHIDVIKNFNNDYNAILRKGLEIKDDYLIKFALNNGAYSKYITDIKYLLENNYISEYNLINKHPHIAFKYYTDIYNKVNLLSCLETGIIPDNNFIKHSFNKYDDDVLIQILKNGITDLETFKEYVIYYGKNNTLKYFLENLKDDNDSLIFLLYSIKHENYNGFNIVLNYMIKNNFDLNYSSGYLFYYTVKNGQLNMLEKLVNSGLRFGEYYNKSLEVAKSSGYDDIYKYIIKLK